MGTTGPPRNAPTAESGTERGTALILVPTLMLVLLALMAIAIDLTAMHGAHRSLQRVVSAAADDAANMIDTRELQSSGAVRIDDDAARRVVAAHVESTDLPGELVGPVVVQVSPAGDVVEVRLDVDVPHLITGSAPGTGGHERLTVVSRGRLHP